MEKKITLGVSIVTYNSASDTLLSTIDSILEDAARALAAEDFEVCVVDNCSTSNIFNVLQSKYNSVPQVNIVKSPRNGGYGYGNNLGFANIPNSIYHMVVNPDVVVQSGAIGELLKFIKNNSNIAMCVPRVLNQDLTVQALNKRRVTVLDLFLRFLPSAFHKIPSIYKRLEYFCMKDVGYENPTEVDFASGCFMLFRSECYSKIKGFDENYFLYMEDADISLRASKVGKVMFCPTANVVHLWSRASRKSLKFMLCHIRSAIYFFRKNGLSIF